MSDFNPYSAPKVDILKDGDGKEYKAEAVASGQKIIIYAILVYFVTIVGQILLGPMVGILGLVMLVLGVIGIVKLTQGLGYSVLATILYIIAMIIPLVGLLLLLHLNGKATKLLKENGYRVGLMGASKPVQDPG